MDEYIKGICGFVIISTVINNLFPNDKYLKYVKMFSGFLIIMIILEPISHFVGADFDFDSIVDEIIYTQDSVFYDNDEVEEISKSMDDYGEIIEERMSENQSGMEGK